MPSYDKMVDSLRNITQKVENSAKQNNTLNESVSSVLAAELTLISTILIAAIMLRYISTMLTVVVLFGVILLLLTNLPIMPRIKNEQSDSLNQMMFYVIITLGILITVIYWGTTNV